MSLPIKSNEPLAPYTTLQLGGPARFFVTVSDENQLAEALDWAGKQGIDTFILGAGSNLIVADAGYDGLVVRMAIRGLTFGDDGACSVAAGERWDDVVAASVARNLGGIECLSGIPGTTGATPVQNVGAYGQEVADTISEVRVLDRTTKAIATFTPAACGFAYRDSVFKQQAGRHVVLSVGFALQPGAAPAQRYTELRTAVAGIASPSLADLRTAVLGLRRRKSMVLDANDPNRRSVGSFFTNPVLDAAAFEDLCARAVALGLVASGGEVPHFPAGTNHKVPAAWLIERAGFHKGLQRGPVGLSTAHTLALVHLGGGSTNALLALAREIRDGVAQRFDVRLVPEPVILGAPTGAPAPSAADPLAEV